MKSGMLCVPWVVDKLQRTIFEHLDGGGEMLPCIA